MDWKRSLADVDEDYLVGISNKGIVKRAYKDLENADNGAGAVPEGTDWSAQELTVAAGGETVTIRSPLGESRCSCPSRSICRHVIMGILLAKQAAAAETDGAVTETDDAATETDSAGQAAAPAAAEKPGESDLTAADDETQTGSDRKQRKTPEESPGDQVWQEVMVQPRKPLLRALGSRALRRLVSAMKAGEAPEVERSSVIRVQLPGQETTVKLLSPLSYSTCTCHKKELCSHKAEAILWCQYLEKRLTAEELAAELEKEQELNLQELQETARHVGSCLEGLLETGLARSGQEQVDELERLAILCHNAGLPGWEGDIRALADSYGKYLRRSAGLTMEKLAGQLQRLYHRTRQTGGPADAALTEAGEFRSAYLPVGDLELTGITVEHFVSDSGYEGDTVYFLETSTGTWYTYTNARPTFYEKKKRGGYQEKAPAPWGVPLSLEELAGVKLRLKGAKCDSGGRLSSSRETGGEVLGRSELTADGLEGWYYREYDRLFAEQIPLPGRTSPPGRQKPLSGGQHERKIAGSGHPRLVFVQADRFRQGQFNEITQKLELPIWDPAGRQVLVELPYSKREEGSIRYLERLKQEQKPCFLGRVYLRDSQICLYPVDLLERLEPEEADGDTASQPEEKSEYPGDGQGEITARSDSIEETAVRALQGYLEEVSWLLQEVYQVGSATVWDSTLEALQRAAEKGRSYGMTILSDWLSQLKEQLALSRHRMKHRQEETMEIYGRLWQYTELCRKRTAYDLARLQYGAAAEEDDQIPG